MSDTDQPPDLLAPVDFAAIEFPDGQATAGGFERLLELVDRGVIHVLDLEFVTHGDGGAARIVPIAAVPAAPGVDLGSHRLGRRLVGAARRRRHRPRGG